MALLFLHGAGGYAEDRVLADAIANSCGALTSASVTTVNVDDMHRSSRPGRAPDVS